MAGEVTSVYAVQNPANDGDRIPRAVTTHVTMTHVGGAISHAVGFWGPSGLSLGPSFDVAGDDGRLQSSPEAMTTVFEDRPGTAVSTLTGAAEEGPFLLQMREFAQVVVSGAPSRVDLIDGVAAVGMAQAAGESVRTGQTVPFEPYAARLRELA
ncbi:MAG: hypothetical protein ACR2I1_03125 [Propionibacteriaceae bacterium]